MGWLSLLPLFGMALGLILVIGTAGLWRGLRRPMRFTYAVALGRGFAVEPSELGLEAQEVALKDAAGLATPAWIVRGKQADGPVVVMMHGFGRSRYSLLPHAATLAEFASKLVLWDLPGHGESAAKFSRAGIDEWRDVAAVVGQVTAPGCGDEPVVLYGRSMGAGVALAAAAHEPGRYAGVIAEGVYRTWNGPIRRRLWLRRYPAEPFTCLVGLMARLCWPGLGDFDRAELARRVTCPILLLHGAKDEVCLLDDAQRVAAAAASGQGERGVELVVFEEGRHLDLHEVDPARYRDALARWFAKLAPTPTPGSSPGSTPGSSPEPPPAYPRLPRRMTE